MDKIKNGIKLIFINLKEVSFMAVNPRKRSCMIEVKIFMKGYWCWTSVNGVIDTDGRFDTDETIVFYSDDYSYYHSYDGADIDGVTIHGWHFDVDLTDGTEWNGYITKYIDLEDKLERPAMTVEEVAKELGVSKSTVYKLIKSDKLDAYCVKEFPRKKIEYIIFPLDLEKYKNT